MARGKVVLAARRGLALGFVVLAMVLVPVASAMLAFTGDSDAPPARPSLVFSGPIDIAGNAELDAFCAGNGTDGLTPATAHRIEGFRIEVAGTGTGIRVSNTTRYLVLSGCEVVGAGNGLPGDGTGINVYICENVTIEDCTVEGLGTGLSLNYSRMTRVVHLSAKDNHQGLHAYLQSETSVSGCTMSGNEVGMDLQFSWSIRVSGCTIDASGDRGLRSTANDVMVDGCTFTGNAMALEITGQNTTVSSSTFDGPRPFTTWDTDATFTGNTIVDSPVDALIRWLVPFLLLVTVSIVAIVATYVKRDGLVAVLSSGGPVLDGRDRFSVPARGVVLRELCILLAAAGGTMLVSHAIPGTGLVERAFHGLMLAIAGGCAAASSFGHDSWKLYHALRFVAITIIVGEVIQLVVLAYPLPVTRTINAGVSQALLQATYPGAGSTYEFPFWSGVEIALGEQYTWVTVLPCTQVSVWAWLAGACVAFPKISLKSRFVKFFALFLATEVIYSISLWVQSVIFIESGGGDWVALHTGLGAGLLTGLAYIASYVVLAEVLFMPLMDGS